MRSWHVSFVLQIATICSTKFTLMRYTNNEVRSHRGRRESRNISDTLFDDVGTQLHSENGSTKNIIPRYTVRQVIARLLYDIGEYPFHKHDTTDDFFYVLEGEMEMDIKGELPRTVKAGELFVVPKSVVHRPRARNEVKVLLIEPKGEPNSGDSDREPAPKPRI